MPTKSQYYAMIHLGAARLGYTDKAEYRAWLHSLCGKHSAKECTLQELAAVVATLRLCNALEHPKVKAIQGGVINDERPTKVQWSVANQRSQTLGMTGCDDERFTAFAKKICKVDHPRFLTRDGMRKLIAALNKWIANNEKKEAKK